MTESPYRAKPLCKVSNLIIIIGEWMPALWTFLPRPDCNLMSGSGMSRVIISRTSCNTILGTNCIRLWLSHTWNSVAIQHSVLSYCAHCDHTWQLWQVKAHAIGREEAGERVPTLFFAIIAKDSDSRILETLPWYSTMCSIYPFLLRPPRSHVATVAGRSTRNRSRRGRREIIGKQKGRGRRQGIGHISNLRDNAICFVIWYN